MTFHVHVLSAACSLQSCIKNNHFVYSIVMGFVSLQKMHCLSEVFKCTSQRHTLTVFPHIIFCFFLVYSSSGYAGVLQCQEHKHMHISRVNAALMHQPSSGYMQDHKC